MFEIRLFNLETDFPRLAEIINATEVEPVTVALLKQNFSMMPPENPCWHAVAVDTGGRVIGCGRCVQSTWLHKGDFWIGVDVDPAWYQQKIGTTLYEQGLQFARQQAARRLFCGVRDDFPVSLQFAEKRGFVRDRHIFDSLLDIAAFDPAAYAGTIEAVEQSGIRFTTLAELGDTLENRHKVFDILISTNKDVPGDNHGEPKFDDFQKGLYEIPEAMPDATIIALDGDQWAGIVILCHDNDELIANYMTGVERPYRGRKIAWALKLLSVECARRRGKLRMMTNNDSINAPMLAINRRMGYRELPGRYTMIRTL